MGDKEEFAFLNDVGTKEMGIVAQIWAEKKGWEILKAEANCRSWLGRIRAKVKRQQTYLNTIYALQKKSARIRKFTTSGALPAPPDEEEE
jgi:hypothetical protein